MIILSLPYQDSLSLLQHECADYIEYRLDYCLDPAHIDFSVFTGKHILTWRSSPNDNPFLPKMLKSKALVDLDISECKETDNLDKVIVSLHLAEFNAQTIKEFLRFPAPCFALKIVFEASSFEETIACSRLIAKSGKRVIFNVNGKWAAFQRSLNRHFNSQAVYLFHFQSTYPGQLSLKDYRLIASKGIKVGCRIYGIIGGAQVNTSLSLKHYNQLFSGTDSHYLPIPAASPKEAISVLKWLETKFILRAFSITSPFKRSLPQSLTHTEGIYNTLIYTENGQIIWHNTDLIALNKSLQELQIQPDDSILIYGSGDCAEAFIPELQRKGYKKLYLSARNPISCKRLRDIYRLPQNAPKQVKLLINASAGLSFALEPGNRIPCFESLIELPYSATQESSLCAYAHANTLPYVDGEAFFQRQFSAQMELFVNGI